MIGREIKEGGNKEEEEVRREGVEEGTKMKKKNRNEGEEG